MMQPQPYCVGSGTLRGSADSSLGGCCCMAVWCVDKELIIPSCY
jgi:hypothetical protein